MSYTLPNALVPEGNESLAGLVMRNTVRYRFPNPVRLLHRLDLHQQFLPPVCQADPAGELGQRLRCLLDLDERTYRRHSPWSPDPNRHAVLGHGVWKELVRAERRAVCPACLRASPHHRAVWHVAALNVCTLHGTRLLDRCPNPSCGKPLRWNGRSHCACEWRSCQFDLRRAEAAQVEGGVPPGLRALVEALESGTPPASTPPGVPPGELVTLAFMLGRLSLITERGRGARPMPFIERHPERVPAVMGAGWNALDDWPHGFTALLDDLKERGKGRRGVAQAFGDLTRLVHGWSREPWGAPIGRAFAEYAAAQPDLAVSPEALRRYAPGAALDGPHTSITQAALMFGFSAGAMQRLAERRGLFVLAPQGVGVSSLLRTDALVALREEFADSIHVDEARAMLGVSYKPMLELEAAGLIRQVPEGERIMEFMPFRRSHVAAFIDSCQGRGPPMSEAKSRDLGLTTLTRATAIGRGIVDLCRAMADGRLKSRGIVRAADGLLRPRVDMADVNRVLPPNVPTLSIVEAARAVRTNYWNLHVWTRHGFLAAAETGRPGERGLRITPEAWARFRAEFVVGDDMRELLGKTGYHWLSRHLLHQGVRPVSGPGVDEGGQMLFRRSDCTPEIVAAIRGLRKQVRGTPQTKVKRAAAKAGVAAEAVAAAWRCQFERKGNRFTEISGPRVVQVVSGRRSDLTGAFRFMLRPTSIAALAGEGHGWAALVPSKGRTIILVPFPMLEWRGKATDAQYVAVPFDGRDRPGLFREFTMTLPGEGT